MTGNGKNADQKPGMRDRNISKTLGRLTPISTINPIEVPRERERETYRAGPMCPPCSLGGEASALVITRKLRLKIGKKKKTSQRTEDP